MDDDLTFAEIIARVPREKRTDGVAVLVAVRVLQQEQGSTLATSDIAGFLKHHMRGKAPRNTSDTLSKLVPLVERIQASNGSLRWRLTQSGLRRLGELAQISVLETGRVCTLSVPLLHPRIVDAVKDLLQGGHFSEAVGRAAKELNRLIRDKTGRSKDEGVQMMHQVFSETENAHRRLIVRPIKEEWERDLQAGLRFMMAGCQAGIANVDKHGDLLFDSETEALECLALISHLARRVDRATLLEPLGSSVVATAIS